MLGVVKFMSHPTLDEWLNALHSLGPTRGVELDNYRLKSPTFKVGGWRVGVEHQRQFESVVVRWVGPEGKMPAPPEHWAVCPRSYRNKGWLYRVVVRPERAATFLDELGGAPRDLNEVDHVLEQRVANSLSDSSYNRKARLAARPRKPLKILVTATVFDRDPDVVAEVLLRAAGECENCKRPAPFLRRSDRTPYLEVHHVIRLSNGGDDTVENAIAVCPNCHRAAHYA